MKVKITFQEELLGTIPGNKEIFSNYINTKCNTDEDETAPDEQISIGTTYFHRVNGVPVLYDYTWKGFFKEACKTMISTDTITKEELKKVELTNYLCKRTIDNLIFVKPRTVNLIFNGETTFCERSLRVDTMRGERVALGRSEAVPVGTTCEMEILCLNKKLYPYVEQWLKWGELKGTGQWRNSGKGRFTTEIIE